MRAQEQQLAVPGRFSGHANARACEHQGIPTSDSPQTRESLHPLTYIFIRGGEATLHGR